MPGSISGLGMVCSERLPGGDSMIIALSNQKGGVGKTTVGVHLAIGAARRGKRVVLVDADPQGNATSWLTDGADNDGMYRLLMDSDRLPRVVQPLSSWGLSLVGGNVRTGEALTMLAAVNRLAEIPPRLWSLERICDFVFVDMPPSRAAGFMEILSSADRVIVPTTLERLSLEGVALMGHAVNCLPNTKLMGIVPNMTRRNTKEHQAQMQDLVGAFGQSVWPPIPLAICVTEASSFGSTVWDMGASDAATAMTVVLDRMWEVLYG